MFDLHSNKLDAQLNDKFNYIFDYKTGDVIDPITGEVVDRIYVSEHFLRDKKSDTIVFHHEVPHFSSPLSEFHLPNRRYECLLDILERLDILRKLAAIPISDYEVELTLRHILRSLGLHPYTEAFKTALLYIALEILGVPVDVKTIASIFGVRESELNSEIFKLKKELNEKSAVVKKEPGHLAKRVALFVELFARKLSLPYEVVSSAVSTAISKQYPSRFTPRTIAAAILYIEMAKHKLLSKLKSNNELPLLKVLGRTLGIASDLSKVVKFVCKYYYNGEVDACKDPHIVRQKRRNGGG